MQSQGISSHDIDEFSWYTLASASEGLRMFILSFPFNIFSSCYIYPGSFPHIRYNCLLLAVDINSLAPGRFEYSFIKTIFKLILAFDGWSLSYGIVLRCMSLDLTVDKSTLVQVMAWCRQATSHHLSQCWPRSLLPCSVTRPQWYQNSKRQIWYKR